MHSSHEQPLRMLIDGSELRVGSCLLQIEALEAAAATAPQPGAKPSEAGSLVRSALWAAGWTLPWALPFALCRQLLPRRRA